MLICRKNLDRHRIREVRHIKEENGLFVLDFPLVKIHDFAADYHFAHLTNDILYFHGFLFKIPAIKDIRVVRTLKSFLELTCIPLRTFKVNLWRTACLFR